MSTPAEELRAAATKLRETASKATPATKWQLLSYQIVGLYDEAADTVTDVAFTYGNQPNARWIALASPALAEPLAALLDAVADQYEADHRIPDGVPCDCWNNDPMCRAALATARAINGDPR